MIKSLRTIAAVLDGHRLLPLACFIVLPALAVRASFVSVAPDAAALAPWVEYGDTRSWWKAVFAIGCGLWFAVHAACRLAGGWRPRFMIFGALLLLAALGTTLSALLSDFPHTAWLGYTFMYEGGLVLLAYLLGIWYAAEMTGETAARLFLVRLVGCVGLVNAVHGVFEGLGWNFWASSPGRWLMGAGDGEVTFYFSALRMAYGTLFQPNHYGMFMAMSVMLALGMIFVEGRMGWRIFWAAGLACGAAGVVFSNSRMAVAVCAAVGLPFLAVRAIAAARRPHACGASAALKQRIAPLGAVLAVVCIVAALGGERLAQAARTLGGRVAGTFSASAESGDVEAVELDGGVITLRLKDTAIELARKNRGRWRATTRDGSRPSTRIELVGEASGDVVADIPGVAGGTIRVRPDGIVLLAAPGLALEFFFLGDELFAVDRKGILYDQMPVAAGVGFGPLGRHLGGRGHTWSRALALVSERPWFGGGPGSFALVFPNDELLARQRYLDDMEEDKGHGIWATYLVQLGIVGFLPYLLVVGYVFSRRPWRGGIGTPLTLGMLAFLLSALTNDSTVGVTPVFCGMAGLALAEADGQAPGLSPS